MGQQMSLLIDSSALSFSPVYLCIVIITLDEARDMINIQIMFSHWLLWPEDVRKKKCEWVKSSHCQSLGALGWVLVQISHLKREDTYSRSASKGVKRTNNKDTWEVCKNFLRRRCFIKKKIKMCPGPLQSFEATWWHISYSSSFWALWG